MSKLFIVACLLHLFLCGFVSTATAPTTSNSTSGSSSSTVTTTGNSTVESSTGATSDKSTGTSTVNSTVESSTGATSDKFTDTSTVNSTVESSTGATDDKFTDTSTVNSNVESSTGATDDKSTGTSTVNSTVESSTGATNDKSTGTSTENSTFGISTAGTNVITNIAHTGNSTESAMNDSTIKTTDNPNSGTTNLNTAESSSPSSSINTVSAMSSASSSSLLSTTSTFTLALTSTTKRSHGHYNVPQPFNMSIVAVQLQLKWDLYNFTDDLNDTDSDNYNNMTLTLKHKIEKEFKNSTTARFFLGVTIDSLWKGSIGVKFTASYKNISTSTLNASLHKEVYTNLRDFSDFNQTFTEERFLPGIDEALKNLCSGTLNTCPNDFHCIQDNNLQPICEHHCSTYDCQNGGYCVLDVDYQPTCRCSDDEDSIYGREHCEVSAEKLALSKEYIIAIAAGAGGGIILILITVIVIVCHRNRLKKRQKDDAILDNVSDQSYKSIKGSEDGLRQPVIGSGNMTIGYSSPTFRLSEERAENPRFNPYLSIQNMQPPAAVQSNPRDSGRRQQDGIRQSPKGESDPQNFQRRQPLYDEPLVLPRFHFDPATSDYSAADDKRNRNHPTKAMQPLAEFHRGGPQRASAEPRVYDYTPRSEPRVNGLSSPKGNTDLYDFDYENGVRQERAVRDPYSMKSPLVSPPGQFTV